MKDLIKLTLRYRGPKELPKGCVYLRRVVVPSTSSLAFLHEVIQIAFGWMNCHMYQFTKGEACYVSIGVDSPLDDESFAKDFAIGEVLPRKGSACVYEYDFSDGNTVDVRCEGFVEGDKDMDDFWESKGVDMVEDSASFGYAPGIVELLTQRPKSKEAKACIQWLDVAFGFTPSHVLREPTSQEIASRVLHLIQLVMFSLPHWGEDDEQD